MKTKLTVENLADRITRDNEKFAKARPATKRVIIAKDCLSRIRIGQILPVAGGFCEIEYSNFAKKEENVADQEYDEEDYQAIYSDRSIKDILNTSANNVQICESCAKGSLLMTYLGRVNEFTFEDLEQSSGNRQTDESHQKLLQLFSKEQLTLIETFFEGTQCIFHDVILKKNEIHAYRSEVFNRPEYIKISRFPKIDIEGYVYDNSDYTDEVEGKILMIEICKNIIQNKGTFVLPKL